MLSDANQPLDDHLIEQARRDVTVSGDLLGRYQTRRMDELRLLAGSGFDTMLRSYQDTESNLSAADPNVRISALLLVRDYWHPPVGFWQKCLEVAFQDPSPLVRGIAFFTLLRCHAELPRNVIELLIRITTGSRTVDILGTQKTEADECRDSLLHSQRSRRTQIWKKTVGNMYDEIRATPYAVASYLSSPDPNARLAALSLLEETAASDFAEVCEKLAFEDPIDNVREIAVVLLGTVLAGGNDRKVGRRLAQSVQNESEPARFRRLAYGVLFQLRGLPVQTWPSWNRRAGFTFPTDVDWDFVETFSL
jgi:HEAT repeat protein